MSVVRERAREGREGDWRGGLLARYGLAVEERVYSRGAGGRRQIRVIRFRDKSQD